MRIILLTMLACLAFSCAGELTHEDALKELGSQVEFQTPFYAPMHIGREVLSGKDHKDAQGYIQTHLGKLISEGVVQAKIVERNSWRSVLMVELTDKGRALVDPSRSVGENYYVQVCKVTPTQVDTLEVVTAGEEMVVGYTFTQSEVTPFGEHLEFVNGRTHKDKRTFKRSGMSWELVTI